MTLNDDELFKKYLAEAKAMSREELEDAYANDKLHATLRLDLPDSWFDE